MMSKRLLACVAVTIGATAIATPGAAAPATDSSAPLRTAVKATEINDHLKAFQRIANRNIFNGNPTRATGTPGHEASADYVAQKMSAAGFTVTRQPFEADIFFEEADAVFERVSPDPLTYERYDGDSGVWYTADFSGDGDATTEAVVVDFTEPTTTASASDSGCETADFDPAAGGVDVTGQIALLQRGTCDFGVKVENAQAAGAVGAVIFNEGTIGEADRNDILIPTLSGYDATIPVVGTDYATGRDLVDRVAQGPVVLHLMVDGFVDQDVATENVIAETKAGRADRTVVVGGHLDSVHEGPGINDNGSGTGTMLETAEQMQKLGLSPRNKVRFIFFSGEEQGLLGSAHYVSTLSPKEISNISVNLNFDMLGSPNFARFVYDGDGSDHGVKGPSGSGTVEEVFGNYYDSQGLAYETTAFDGRSDYEAFTLAGIPAGGLFSGAEGVKTEEQQDWYGGTADEAYDPCYHQACDDIRNISMTGLEQHADAAVHGIWTFAQTGSDVSGTATTTATKDDEWKGDKRTR